MERYIVLILLAMLSGAASETVLSDVNMYDCRREGISCRNGDCSPQGACVCDADSVLVEADHCIKSPLLGSLCDGSDPNCPVLGDEGTCYGRAGLVMCYCSQLHAGSSCEDDRVGLTCGTDSLSIVINPIGSFAGHIYVEGQREAPGCTLTAGSPLELALDACGLTPQELTDAGGLVIGSKYSLKVVVQYSADILLHTDQELTLTCNYPDTAEVSGVVFQTTANGNLDAGSALGEGSAELTLGLVDANNVAVTDSTTLNVGDDLDIKIVFNPSEVYKSFKVSHCFAANSDVKTDPPAVEYAELDVVNEGGCPSDTSVVRGDHTLAVVSGLSGVTAVTVTIPLYAFMFTAGSTGDSNSLYVSCNIQLCATDSDEACQESECILERRRRRAADDSVVTLGQGLIVRFGNTTPEKKTPESGGASGSTEQCLRNPDLQTILSVLAFFLLLLFILVCGLVYILCRRSSRRRRQHGDKVVNDGFASVGGSSQQELKTSAAWSQDRRRVAPLVGV